MGGEGGRMRQTPPIESFCVEARDFLAEALSGRYRIEREIGRGGMAVVYLAHDVKLDRPVALKVLRPEIASSLGTDRFLREIRIAAKLSHPNILGLHDYGEADGLLFYTMPYVEGESLRDRLSREKQLPLEDAIQTAQEVAEALDYAHGQGLVHRDIKPENILFLQGHALVADFGIARAVREAGGMALTEAGLAVGTPAYMSPEQASGECGIDHRSDQYSLGCVLYEMLSGDAPYLASTPQAVLARKLSDPVPRITVVRDTVPATVEQALKRALAKVPADRFKTARAFAAALDLTAAEPVRGRGPWGRTKAVVFAGMVVLGLVTVGVIAFRRPMGGPELMADLVLVLPFANETGDAQYDPVLRTMAHSAIDRLYGAGVSRVVPYDNMSWSWDQVSERSAREPGYDPVAAVVAEYGAGTVVSGRVSRQRDSVRFTAEIRGEGGAKMGVAVEPVVVAAHENGIMDGIDQVSERITAAVLRYLDPDWSDVPTHVTTEPPPTLAVLQAMDRAYEAWARREMQECRTEAERAQALDPDYLPAKTFLAHFVLSTGPPAEADSLLKELEGHIDRMAPAEKIQVESDRARLEGDLEARYSILKEGVQRTPTPVGALAFGWAARDLNRPREALEAIEGVDPESPSLVRLGQSRRLESDRCEYLHLLGRYRQELREVRRLRDRDPDRPGFIIVEIRAQAALGHVEEVWVLAEDAIRREAQPAAALSVAALELQAHEHPEAALTFLERLLAYLQESPAEVRATPSHRSQLFRALYGLERWDEAQAIAEELAQEQPSNPDHIAKLGNLAARRGQREEARRVSERLAAMEIPYDRGRSTYLRACIAALLGERDEAIRLLREAHGLGWPFSIELHRNPDLETLRDYPPYEDFVRLKG